jgi:uridine kinase
MRLIMTDTTDIKALREAHNIVTVTISGPVGCGKSAIYGELEIALRAMGIPVAHADQRAADYEKWATHADWASELEIYNPTVVLVEKIERNPS